MANDSSTGGYLLPTTSSPQGEDDALDAVFQQLVVGITGLPGAYVRPRWQSIVPKQPEASVNWCAIGVSLSEPEGMPAIVHQSGGSSPDGQDVLYRNERISVLASFYGPGGGGFSSVFRDGLFVAQNNGALTPYGIGFYDIGPRRSVPELVNQQWIKRYDVELILRRQVVRTYAVLNLLSLDGSVSTDSITNELNAEG
ncbi:phage neck terminator protein [Robbsia andropogonis]|uniref:phage neck terminator protein n=1 Tax=Robbsia andropogonis TaxID=28092 RepID=UPI0004635EF6